MHGRTPAAIPFARLTTVFLDVGNTLMSIDFEWAASEVSARGYACTGEGLRRAEAAARPALSALVGRGRSTEPADTVLAHLRLILTGLPPAAAAGPEAVDRVARALLPLLHRPGEADQVWRMVMPGVPDALEHLRALGLALVVVSNADGTVERSLTRAGLRPHFAHVLDSALVGFEKPDPRIFHEALRRSGADPAHTLHVGDLFHADVVGGRGAGLHAALLDPFGDWNGIDCPVFPDLAALVQTIARHRARVL